MTTRSAEAALAGQAAHARRCRAALAGAALRTELGHVFRAPGGDGEPWKRVLRRAASDEEARKIFEQADRALDTEQGLPVGADVRASRTIRMLGEEYLEDSIKRGKQPRTMGSRRSRLKAHIVPTIGDVPVAKWRL